MTATEIELQRSGRDTPTLVDFVKSTKELSDIPLKRYVTFTLLSLFGVSTVSTYVLIFLWGYQRVSFPPAFVHWLGAATIGQTSGMLYLIVNSLFPKTQASKQKRKPKTMAH